MTIENKFFFTKGGLTTFTKVGNVDDTNRFGNGGIRSKLFYAVNLVAVGIVTGKPILGNPVMTRTIRPVDPKRLITLRAENRIIDLESETRFITLKSENRVITID